MPETIPDNRPSLAQLAAQAQSATADPWACPKCHCKDWRVLNTYECKDGTKHRRVYCRRCKYVRMTYERPMDQP